MKSTERPEHLAGESIWALAFLGRLMATKRPWFAFYASDWLSSRSVLLMTPEQRGGYIQLLCHAWLSEDCGLSNDPGDLAVLSGLNGRWEECSPRILACFEIRSGRLFNPRLLKEKKAILEIVESRSQAGKKGAHKRWNGKELDGKAIILPMAKNSHSHSQSECIRKKAPTPAPLNGGVGGVVPDFGVVSTRPKPKERYP